MSSSIRATSQIEKHFQTNNVYKRSRRYFDIRKLNELEHQEQLSRRKPSVSLHNDTLESNVEDNFLSSEQLLNLKVNRDLQQFKQKYIFSQDDDAETNYSFTTKSKNIIDMHKMIPRQLESQRKPAYFNESQFNNYASTTSRQNRTVDFNKLIARNDKKRSLNESAVTKSQNSTNKDSVGRMHEKLMFDQSIFRCLMPVHQELKKASRIMINPESAPVRNLEKIKIGEDLTHKKINPSLGEFYHSTGKSEPSQMDNRLIKHNEYFWNEYRNEERQRVDYLVQKRKEDHMTDRLEKILARKHLPDERNDMCDLKYFRRLQGVEK